VKADDYRKQVEKELAGAAPPPTGRVRRLRTAANPDTRLGLDERRDAVRAAVDKLADLPKSIPELLAILASPEQPEPLRGSALSSLLQARFVVTAFAPHRADFLRTLHAILPGAGPELRERVMEALALEKDPEAQALLVEGLRDPAKALVPPLSALQYLSYDDHAGYAPAVRELAAGTEDDQLKAAALRLLANDPDSEKLFRKLVADRGEMAEIRQISAAALQMLNPVEFEKVARNIATNDDDYAEIRAAVLGALTHMRDYARSRADAKFVAEVDRLKETAHGFLRSAAAQFLKRSG
jgi:hypothetical protein